MPRLNLRLDSKELMVLVTRTDTVGLVMTVTLPSILPLLSKAADQTRMLLDVAQLKMT